MDVKQQLSIFPKNAYVKNIIHEKFDKNDNVMLLGIKASQKFNMCVVCS